MTIVIHEPWPRSFSYANGTFCCTLCHTFTMLGYVERQDKALFDTKRSANCWDSTVVIFMPKTR